MKIVDMRFDSINSNLLRDKIQSICVYLHLYWKCFVIFMYEKGHISHPWIFVHNGFLELDLVACSLQSKKLVERLYMGKSPSLGGASKSSDIVTSWSVLGGLANTFLRFSIWLLRVFMLPFMVRWLQNNLAIVSPTYMSLLV